MTDLLKEVRQSLADCLFCWACQTPLSREDTLHLLNHLKKEEGVLADGTLDQVLHDSSDDASILSRCENIGTGRRGRLVTNKIQITWSSMLK